jgi:hypothetical protein
MIGMRLAGAVLAAAILASCFTYLVTSPPPQRSVPVDPAVPGTAAGTPAIVEQRQGEEQRAATAFERAAAAILLRLPDATAYAGADEPPVTGHIPLPKKRPVPR